MGIACLEGLQGKVTVPQTASKRIIAEKWVVSGYIQQKGKAENVGQMRVGICEVGKNPAYNSVDAQIALSIVQDVCGALNLTPEQIELVESIPIVQALQARKAMLTDPAAIAEAKARVKAKTGDRDNPLVNTVNAALSKLDSLIEADNGNSGQSAAAALVTPAAPLSGRTRK